MIGDLSLMGLGVRARGAGGTVAVFATGLGLGEARRGLGFCPFLSSGLREWPMATGEGDVSRRVAGGPTSTPSP